MHPRPTIPAADRIPLGQKIAFGAGGSMDYMSTGMITGVFWMPFFNIGLGLSPALLGLVLVIMQVWNAITDPVMANISDNARTRWGRRRPFMFVGAILTGIMYFLFWHLPIGTSPLVNGIWLAGMGMLFYTCFASWSMPYYSLQLELTPNYDERTRLVAWIALFSKITGLVAGWAMAFVTSSYFANPVTGEADVVNGVRSTAWIMAVGIIALGLLPSLFVKERYYKPNVVRPKRESLWHNIRESAGCKPLWNLIGISVFFVLGSGCVGVIGTYVSIYYVNHGDLAEASIIAGWKSTVLMTTGLLSIPFCTWLSEKFDKRSVVFGMLCVSCLGHLSNYWLMTPEHPYWQIIPAVFESGAIGAVWIFLPSMKADVADYDELATSRRREGSLNSFYSWFLKATFALSAGLGGILLQFTGFDVAIGLEQPPEVLRHMFWLYLIIPIFIWAVALYLVSRYPLDRERMAEIRAALELRRGQV